MVLSVSGFPHSSSHPSIRFVPASLPQERTFIYPFFTRGRPFPLQLLFFGTLFCIYNGFLQGYYLIYCAEYPTDWCTDIRFTSGLLLFLLGMGINIHSDLLLRQLRKPGEVTYKIPQGGLFTYVSGANYFGEIVEWFGFAIATWSLPAFTFAFFTLCCIGPRAYHHHRYYLKTFTDYPKSRKALIPFVFNDLDMDSVSYFYRAFSNSEF
ncbi:3-oxo-5-alpha-steroid 4-dehydrogenase 2 isoform X1 [Meleagris gallopavo]|uniref:3-oxo-5-alpha-steroid 4-dehydrogenase 2 isoform X1 n=1 Tax=Meleagris gallopavo TaxID=9103 RepID=UPI000549C2B5|nr:3-oxo-5-alpha-steroid 4-dehydrogenase 2 isoform X1 [Meleagris gallopavo]XP_010705152.1 3-oxo-5-alpha-steroid 4-dehydrogenase 2 isoform X1 [Meleagris gallopavo]XP_019468312.1 3-oxo-5-alpha-steroid 4-dehydrogenase 2 isoform X1 [Meleagris gallopavo]